MGVDFYTCSSCERTFPDCSYYFTCTGCEMNFCSDKCGGREETNEDDDLPRYERETSCVLCRKDEATDNQLLYFLLKKYNLTYDQIMEMYRKED